MPLTYAKHIATLAQNGVTATNVQDALEDLAGAGPGATDHGALTGLADDDHAQYHNDARGDARYSLLAHNHTGTYQPLDATLTALAGLNGTAGVVEQTGVDAFTKRAFGVANATDVPTRADADTRYAAASHGAHVPVGGLTGQALAKTSGADGDVAWYNLYGNGIVVVTGVPSGGSDQAVLNAAIAAAGANGTIYLPRGTWRTAGGLAVAVNGFRIVGAGKTSTYIRLDASADGQAAITVDSGASLITDFQLEDIGITTGTSSFNKIGLRLVDAAETRLHNVNITGFNDAGTDSVGLWTEGRESLWCSDMQIGAVIPIRLSKRARASEDGYISIDHFTFNNMLLVASDTNSDLLHKSVVLVDGSGGAAPLRGLHGLNLQFTGSQAWIMGSTTVACDGFYWDNSTGDPTWDYTGNLSFNNVRTEQGTVDPTKWSIYISHGTTLSKELRNVSITNCNLNAGSEGIYTRNVKLLTIRDTNLSHVSGRKILDCDGFRSLVWDNVWTKATGGGSINVNGATLQSYVPAEVGYDNPHTAVWGEGARVAPKRTIGITFDGDGAPPTVGSVGLYVSQFAGTIDRWDMVGDVPGSAVVDVWKLAGAIPTDANRIAGTEKPTLSAAQLAADTSLTTWSTLAVAVGDVLGFELESVTTCTRVTAQVRIAETL